MNKEGPYFGVYVGVLVIWLLLSIALTFLPRGLATGITGGRIELSRFAIWVWRVLGVVNAIGALHLLIQGATLN